MRPRNILITLIACSLLLAWWLAHPPSATLPPATRSALANAACPLPPSVQRGEIPRQTDVPAGLTLPQPFKQARITPLAGISIDARVLSRESYVFDTEAQYSPIDLALGWGRMRDDAVLNKLSISQGGRWYHYRWKNTPPIPVDEIARSSANMHMVPANDDVADALSRIEAGQNIRIDGWLIRLDTHTGWHWVSSLRRDDSGGGACELVYACAVTPH